MERLLCIVGGMNAGGAETFLMKLYRALDKSKYQMDFAVSITDRGVYDDEIESMGGKIHHIVPKSAGLIKNFKDIKRLVKENQYKYVLRVSQNSMSALELLAAKKGGAEVRAFRSSNSNSAGGKKDRMIHSLCMFMPKMFANVRIAPSTEAAEFMFGKNCVAKKKAALLHNAIDLSVFRFDEEDRKRIREEFNITDSTFTVGHVGRFSAQKNHMQLLEIFAEIVKKRPDSLLMLVGKGELEEKIREKADSLDISEKVIFTGVRQDVPAILCAMDAFLFPSFYEGMPNTVIEAQAAGLDCVISDTITKEANITGLVTYLPLSAKADEWADTMLDMPCEHTDTTDKFIENKYDIGSAAEEFVRLIFKNDK